VHAENFADVKPSPQQVERQDLEFGVIIHFGTNTFLDREWGDGKADPGGFNPTQLDAEQWMQAIQAAGAKYVIVVAKHHDGFCLWPTAQTSYSVKSSPWKNGQGDLLREVSNAARKYGLKFGIYLSPWDRHEPRYDNSAEYDKYYAAQLDELAQNYGELVEFWLDGAGSAGHVYNFPHIIEELRTYQPNTLVFADTGLFEYGDIRWVGNEEGAFPPPDPECSSGSIGPPDPRPPSDGRDWGETYLADPLLLCSLLPPSDPVFSSVSPLVPPALPSYPAALGPATSPSSISVHSSLQNCYASSRSISFSCDCTLSALITASLTPSVIGDRPSHPI